jgi:hypothetical protein
MKTEIFLTSTDAARLLNRSSQRVIQLERAGKLPAIKTANGWRLFRRGDVEALAAELGTNKRSRKA